MSNSCHHDFLCSCLNASETIDYVKKKIESCIFNYMSHEEIVTNLQKNHKISYSLINPVWEQLHRENPDFYKHYHLRCEYLRQIKIFNELFVMQETLAQQFPSSVAMPNTTTNGVTDYYQTGAQAIAPADTAPQDSYVPPDFSGGNLGNNDFTLPFVDSDFLETIPDSGFLETVPDSDFLEIMQFDEIYEPHIEIEKMFAPKEPETIKEQCGGSSNDVQHGETNGQQFGLNFDTSQSMQMYTSFDQQLQAQAVMLQQQQNHYHHYYYAEETIQLQGEDQIPDSEALNNPDSGDGRLTMDETSMISKGSRKVKVSENDEQKSD